MNTHLRRHRHSHAVMSKRVSACVSASAHMNRAGVSSGLTGWNKWTALTGGILFTVNKPFRLKGAEVVQV